MAFTPYGISFGDVVHGSLPVMALSIAVAWGLWFSPNRTIKIFRGFGRGVTALVTFFLAVSAFEEITGRVIPGFRILMKRDATGLTGLDHGLLACGQVTLVLSGAFPLVRFVQVVGRAPLVAWGRSSA